MQKKQITEKTWIITDGETTFGMVNDKGGSLVFISKGTSETFPNWKALENKIGKLKEAKGKVEGVKYVKGYPARHDNVLEHMDEKYPAYTTGGNVVFVAGFFALKFPNAKSWQVVHGPKLTTVRENNLIGPFKTRLEALREANIQNSRNNYENK